MGSDEPLQDALQLVDAHVDVFHHSSVEHCCGDIAATAFFLGLVKYPEHDSLFAREAVADIWDIVEVSHQRLT